MSQKEKSTFSHFFNEEATLVQNIINGVVLDAESKEAGIKVEMPPEIPERIPVSEETYKAKWQDLNAFFRNGNNAQSLKKELIPALFTSEGLEAENYPIWITSEQTEKENVCCLPLRELLEKTLEKIAPEANEASILKQNVARIVQWSQKILANQNKPLAFSTVIDQVLTKLDQELEVTGDETYAYVKSLKSLRESLPAHGVLLPYTSNVGLQILAASIQVVREPARKEAVEELRQLTCRLNDLLRVEREKRPQESDQNNLKANLDFADSMLNFDKLASILPDSGSEVMSENRLARIKKVVQKLESAKEILARPTTILLEESLKDSKKIDWEKLFEGNKLKTCPKGKGAETINAEFEAQMPDWLGFVAALRIGELELQGQYRAEVHDDYFAHFGYENLNAEEWHFCPDFVWLVDEQCLFQNELSKISTLLSRRVPVKIVALKKESAKDPQSTQWQSEMHLSALMLAHQNIYINQSSSINPSNLFEKFVAGLSSLTPAFFSLLEIDNADVPSELWESAAVESRYFPSFTYDGTSRTPWGSRFEVANNPQAEAVWSTHTLVAKNHQKEEIKLNLAFTLADYLVLDASCHQYFKEVDASLWSENLIELKDFLAQETKENVGKVPFIWMLDQEYNTLSKVAVSYQVVRACYECMDYWQFLQENSGIQNYHAKEALARAESLAKEDHEQILAKLKEEHTQELEAARREEAGNAMENLSSILLGLDTNVAFATPAPVSKSQSAVNVQVEETETTEAKEVEETAVDLLATEPYIDTAMCTSCNECLNINNQMFQYNGDKMAYIANPKAGSFKELVEAAESCPVKIIHPGAPLDLSEPDLEELKQRAEKFN